MAVRLSDWQPTQVSEDELMASTIHMQWRRHHGARGARAPHFSEWLGTGGGTVEERLLVVSYRWSRQTDLETCAMTIQL